MVRLWTLPFSRKLSRRRIAGGELRFGDGGDWNFGLSQRLPNGKRRRRVGYTGSQLSTDFRAFPSLAADLLKWEASILWDVV